MKKRIKAISYKALSLAITLIFLMVALVPMANVSTVSADEGNPGDPAVVENLYYEDDDGNTVLLPYKTARDSFIRGQNEKMWEKTRVIVATQRDKGLIVEFSDGTFINYTAVFLDPDTNWQDVRANPSAYSQFHVEAPVPDMIINEEGKAVPAVDLASVGTIDDITVAYGTAAEDAVNQLQDEVDGTLDNGTEVTLHIDWSADANYDPEEPGDYTFVGTLSPKGTFLIPAHLRTVEATVTVEPEEEPETISIQIRIENWDHTTVPLQEIEVAPYDISHVVGDNNVGNWHLENDEPLAIHAIIKALEIEGFDVTDSENVIHVGFQGNYVHMIDGMREMDKGGFSGWMYRVNGLSVNLGVGQQILQDGDRVEMYYRGGTNYHFGLLEADTTEVEVGEPVTFTLKGNTLCLATFQDIIEPVEGAAITIDGVETGFITGADGKVEVTFDEPGSYEISAQKFDGDAYNLVRPVPVVVAVEEAELQNIIGVGEIDNITVDYGTEYDAINFPAEVVVTLEDGSTLSVDVAWESAAAAGYDPNQAGVYTFKGELVNLPANVTNDDNLKAEVAVEVKEAELQKITGVGEFDDITVDYGTEYDAINFPAKVVVTLEDGSTISVDVAWESAAAAGYDPNQAGVYTFKGELVNLPANVTNDDNLKAEVAVEVKEEEVALPDKIESIVVEYEADFLEETIVHIYIKDGYEVSEVIVTIGEETVTAIEVEENLYYLAFFETDIRIVLGGNDPDLSDLSKLLGVLDFTVVAESIIEELNITEVSVLDAIYVSHGTEYNAIDFPQQVEVTLEDDSKLNVDVAWESAAEAGYNPDQAGVYTFNGELVNLPANVTNVDDKMAAIDVEVVEIPEVEVFEFTPAPGQFINKGPWGLNTDATLEANGSGVSLGAFGGSITYRFNEPIKNDPKNKYGVDFIVYGNGFAGNEEPGAIMVAQDINNDGQPDQWYEIAHSEYYENDTLYDYIATYTNPDPEFNESLNVPWTDNYGNSGVVNVNTFHTQPWYPNPGLYADYGEEHKNSLSLSGTRIESRKVHFGVSDVHSDGTRNDQARNPYIASPQAAAIDISWAVDEDHNPVYLEDVSFVKVYTANQKMAGMFGEVSTEVTYISRVAPSSEEVGQTEGLDSLTVAGQSVELEPGTYEYEIEASEDTFDVGVVSTADNIFINNTRSDTASIEFGENEARKVRIIAQDGEKEPVIYMLNVLKTSQMPDLSGNIAAAVAWYQDNHNPPDSWEGMPGLWGLGEDLNVSPWQTTQNWRAADYVHGTQTHWHIHYIFKLLSVEEDPSDAWGGTNIFAELSSLQQEDGSFSGYTLAAHPWPVIALDAGKELGLDVGSWDEESRGKAVDYLLSQQNANNGMFGFGIDTTGYLLIALANYMDDPDVVDAVNNAVGYIQEQLDDEAFFVEPTPWGGRNSNTQALAISGLVAVGENLLGSAWVRGGNTPVDALLEFQQDNGQFYWNFDAPGHGTMAQDDALVALSCLLNGESTWHRMGREVKLKEPVE